MCMMVRLLYFACFWQVHYTRFFFRGDTYKEHLLSRLGRMNTDWVGKSVNLDCGPLGFYQGLIQSLNLKENTITLEKAFLNGRAANVPDVTLR